MWLFGPPRAPGWPETDSPRKLRADSRVETRIRALGTRFVAIFRGWKTFGAPPLPDPLGTTKSSGILKHFGQFYKNQDVFKNCWGDFRARLGLPGPRGGRRWTRLVPQYGFPQFSSNSGLWEAISWPSFVLTITDIRLLKHFSPNPNRFTNKMWGLTRKWPQLDPKATPKGHPRVTQYSQCYNNRNSKITSSSVVNILVSSPKYIGKLRLSSFYIKHFRPPKE